MPQHYIVVGRVSKDTGEKLVHRFGRENIIQSRYGTHSDGEATFELFLDGKLEDHPLEQNLTLEEKNNIRANLRNAHVTIVHSVSGQNTSSRALSLIQSIRALKDDYHVGSVTLIAPHMGLTRSDRKFFKTLHDNGVDIKIQQDNARGNAIMAELIRTAGADRFVGIDFHSNDAKEDYKRVFDINYEGSNGLKLLERALKKAGQKLGKKVEKLRDKFTEALSYNPIFPDNGAVFVSAVKPVLAPYLKSIFNSQADIFNIRIGAPDGANKPNDSGIGRAKEASEALIGYEDEKALFKIAKERISPTETRVIPELSYADVYGKICVLVDDIVNSGSTQIHAAEWLREQGAAKIIAYATHAVLVGDNLRKLLENDTIDQLWGADSVPGVVEKWEKLKQKLSREVRENKISPEKKDHLVSKFTILPVADVIIEQVAIDHGARMQTCPSLVWANENPSNHLIKLPAPAA